MASYLFQNTKTGETKVINSKDSKQAHKYENGTWKYVKAVPKQKPTKKTKADSCSREIWVELCKVSSIAKSLEIYAEDYDIKGLRPMYLELQSIASKLQATFR